MALVFTLDSGFPVRLGKRKVCVGSVAWDNSYPAGGEPVTLANVNFVTTLDSIQLVGLAGGYVSDFDKANMKILMYMGDYDNANDGPLVVCNDTRDLSALTAARFIAYGW